MKDSKKKIRCEVKPFVSNMLDNSEGQKFLTKRISAESNVEWRVNTETV